MVWRGFFRALDVERGRIRPSHLGSHQEAVPSRYKTDGTRSRQTTMASMRTLTARPTESRLMTTLWR